MDNTEYLYTAIILLAICTAVLPTPVASAESVVGVVAPVAKPKPNLPNTEYFSVDAKIGANKIKTVTFVKKDGKMAILAQILTDLLNAKKVNVPIKGV